MRSTVPEPPRRLRTMPSWLLNQAALHANRLVNEQLAASDLRRHHFALLSTLDEVGSASQADLGRRTAIDRSDMVAAVNELSGWGLVERRPDTEDRRRNVVALTASGRRRLAALDRSLSVAQDEL